jgi:hypothetical protein
MTTTQQTPETGHRARAAWSFARHYLEMVLAMLAGMAALGLSRLVVDGPGPAALRLVEMSAWMTVPMVAWMRFRGHHWRPCAEMAAAMALPTAGVLALLATGAATDFGMLMMIEHTAMFPAMLVAMALRPGEYTGHHRHAPA